MKQCVCRLYDSQMGLVLILKLILCSYILKYYFWRRFGLKKAGELKEKQKNGSSVLCEPVPSIRRKMFIGC